MELLVIIAAVIACTGATPVAELLHPSPVNPEVLVAVKPKERIILITDPKEVTKFKRETKQPLFPTVLPEKVEQHTQGILQTETKQNSHKDTLKTKSEEFHQEKEDHKQKPQGLPAVLSLHQEINVPRMQLKQSQKENNERGKQSVVSFKGINKEESNKENDQQDKHGLSEMFQKTQQLPAFFSPSKRDIPVPLVAKHHHPEAAPNENTKKESQKVEIENHVSNEQTTTSVLKDIAQKTEQYKRDIPVPLVSKHHHLEESPKDLDNHEHFINNERVKPQLLPISSNQGSLKDEKSHKENKNSEVKLQNHMSHTSPTQSHEHITTGNFLKLPQVLPIPSVNNNEQIVPTNDQKTQVFPAAYQQMPAANYHPKKSELESNHGKKEITEESAEQPNKPNKQQNSRFTQQEHKPNILDDHLRNRELETSTTEHPIIRNRPVPVAELFSRAHGN